MADEYVRRKDVLKGRKTGTFVNGVCFVSEPCVTVKYIESLKPADVAQVVYGKWGIVVNNHFVGYRCSICNRLNSFSTNYCPNCGAKMDKGE